MRDPSRIQVGLRRASEQKVTEVVWAELKSFSGECEHRYYNIDISSTKHHPESVPGIRPAAAKNGIFVITLSHSEKTKARVTKASVFSFSRLSPASSPLSVNSLLFN